MSAVSDHQMQWPVASGPMEWPVTETCSSAHAE